MEQLSALIKTYPPPSKYLQYGTAGFRDEAELPLDAVFARMGAMACIRSSFLANSLTGSNTAVGVMITASHNPVQDNGVKVVDPDGGMLSQSWEVFCESIANSQSIDDLDPTFCSCVTSCRSTGIVIVGRDTRPHSYDFSRLVESGVSYMGGIVLNLEEVTTPQLHFVVQYLNKSYPKDYSFTSADVHQALQYYFDLMTNGFTTLCQSTNNVVPCSNTVIIDCSFGVGSIAVHAGKENLKKLEKSLEINVRNVVGQGLVNHLCGAEFVQKNQKPPEGVEKGKDANTLMCSFDGDADRVVFHAFVNLNGTDDLDWILFDGDKIASLLSIFLHDELNVCGLLNELTMGVVQTAYANGASTRFLQSHRINISIAKTGVKYLHHEALKYDVGVYFEANGHGTVLLSDHFFKCLDAAKSKIANTDARAKLALSRLTAFSNTINQAVGDAFSDMLCVLAALKILSIDILSWHQLYTDLPSKQIKIPVKNKSKIVCSEDEIMVLSPAALQEELSDRMKSVWMGRCFIRPSGTEDVVRIYAEASSQIDADNLAIQAMDLVNKHIG